MKPTKHRILRAALDLFNEAGSMQVVLQKIADQANMSLGNLTYHFKNKEAIIVALFGLIHEEMSGLFKTSSLIPSETEIMEIEFRLFKFQVKYKFMFLDTVQLIRTSPEIAQKFRENMDYQINIMVSLMQIGVLTNNFRKESYPGEFLRLSKIIWTISFTRVTREEVMGDGYQLTELAEDLWMIVSPFLTDSGKASYRPLFEEYLEKAADFGKNLALELKMD